MASGDAWKRRKGIWQQAYGIVETVVGLFDVVLSKILDCMAH